MRLVPTMMVAALVAAIPAHAAQLKCPADAVKVGNACVDKYEASVWAINPASKSLVKKVQAGKATLDALTDEGATQVSPAGTCTPGFPINFPPNGQWLPLPDSDPPSPGLYALSIPGVKPSACITWFQAEQACALSGKRLASNQEWQQAAAGTPDGAPCVVSVMVPANTGDNPGCVSNWGAFDMVGNVWERIGQWGDFGNGSSTWPGGAFGGDFMAIGGPGSGFNVFPGTVLRGGYWNDGTVAGVFAVAGLDSPFDTNSAWGFRCAR